MRHAVLNNRQRLLRPIERRVTKHNLSTTEKPLRYERMSGLDEEQLDELEYRVAGMLQESWDKGRGRPRELTLREALVVTCGYLWQNIIEEVWADIFGVDQSTVSRIITFLTPLAEEATEGGPAHDGGSGRGHQERDRPGRRHALAVLVVGRRGRAVGWEIQDDRTRVPYSHESARQDNVRVRSGSRQPA